MRLRAATGAGTAPPRPRPRAGPATGRWAASADRQAARDERPPRWRPGFAAYAAHVASRSLARGGDTEVEAQFLRQYPVLVIVRRAGFDVLDPPALRRFAHVEHQMDRLAHILEPHVDQAAAVQPDAGADVGR